MERKNDDPHQSSNESQESNMERKNDDAHQSSNESQESNTERKNDDAYQSSNESQESYSNESQESQSMNNTSTSDDSDNIQEMPNGESQEGPPSMNARYLHYEEEEEEEEEEEGGEDEMYWMALYKLVHSGDWKSVKNFLELHPDALTKKISLYGDTALHIAAITGHVKIVEELVYMSNEEDLELKNYFEETALSLAAGGGITKIAQPLVKKNHNLLSIRNNIGYIPVVVAAKFGQKDMVDYLYYQTQEEDLDPETTDQGAMLLTTCIVAQIYDVALDLVRRFPSLATAQLEGPTGGTLNTLATRPSAFPSGIRFVFWKQWIYSCMPVHSPRAHTDIEAYPGFVPTNQESIIIRGLSHLYGLILDLLKVPVPCIKHIYDIKFKHVQVLKLLGYISREISALNHSEMKETELFQAVFHAVKHGIVEFVEEILEAYPDMVWILDQNSRNIFLCAVLQRREKIFCLLHKMGPKKNLIATSLDKKGNTILHHAAMLSPSSHLDHISGAALEMQRELQWFKEVEKVVPPMYRELQNKQGKTARALFTSEHKKMREEGEKWMKETATSCTVVAALIATIMFTAAFTAPGGYDQQTGDPLHLRSNSFMIFIFSDAFSLFSSASSVLMFLGILKSRYTEAEFLVSLPRKLIVGIATLFVSIATMMLTFGTTIFIVLRDRLTWISIPIVLLCSIPIMIFVFPQVPLLYEICVSTYGPGIFLKPKSNRRYH